MSKATSRRVANPTKPALSRRLSKSNAVRFEPRSDAPKFIDPSQLPDVYALEADGDCLSPIIKSGAAVVFSKIEPPKVGDFVVVYRRPECTPAGEHQAIIKRLAMRIDPSVKFPHRDSPGSEILPLLRLEFINSRRQFYVKCSDVLAVHKAIGIGPEGHVHGSGLRPEDISAIGGSSHAN